MLHVALKQAQDTRNSDAVTYIYDLMANVAFLIEDYKKAEALFVDVMKRLMSDGVPENDLRIIHISLKMCKMFEDQGQFEWVYVFQFLLYNLIFFRMKILEMWF